MDTGIETIEIEFDNFLDIFFRISMNEDSENTSKFISLISELERRLQDLDTPEENQMQTRNLIVLKLLYWEKLLNDSIDFFKANDKGNALLIKSIFYNFNFLIIKSSEAISNPDSTTVFDDLLKLLPHPDDYFIQSSSEGTSTINLSFPVISIKQFLDNYVFKKLHENHEQIPNKELEVFKNIEKQIETGNLFSKTFEKYILSENILSTDVNVLPVQIFLDTNDNKTIIQYYDAVKKLIESLDLEVFYEFEPTKGSWIRRVILRTQKIATSDEVIDRLKKIEHGIETNTINKTQSEIDKNQAEALAAILNASVNIPRLSTLIGSLIIIKTTNERNEPIVYSRTLTTKELIYIKDNPCLLQEPGNILRELAKINTEESSQQRTIKGF